MKKIIVYVLMLMFAITFVGCTNKYVELGVTKNENVAKEWEQNLFSPEEAKDFVSIGVTNPKNATKYRDDGIVPKEWKKEVKTIDEIKEWRKLNLSLDQVRILKKNHTLEEVKKWNSAGVPPLQISKWQEETIMTSENAKECLSLGLDLENIKMWKKEVKTIDEIKEWRKLNLSLGQVHMLNKNQVSYKELVYWKTKKIPLENFIALKSTFVPGVEYLCKNLDKTKSRYIIFTYQHKKVNISSEKATSLGINNSQFLFRSLNNMIGSYGQDSTYDAQSLTVDFKNMSMNKVDTTLYCYINDDL